MKLPPSHLIEVRTLNLKSLKSANKYDRFPVFQMLAAATLYESDGAAALASERLRL
jgi:hypothetical protein